MLFQTQLLLNVDASWKEYTGGDLLTTLTDMFRDIKAVPTLNLDNEIGHEAFGKQGNLISFSNIIGETITSDIADYGMAVHSKLKNATYEADLDIGTTYCPAKGYGLTPRSSEDKYSDGDAEWFLDSGIRRIPQAKILNLNDSGTGTVVADISDWIVSKAEWDDLEIERVTTTLHTGKYKNNTLYYVEGDYIIHNAGVKYKNNGALITGDDAMEHLIKSWWIWYTGLTTRYAAQSMSNIEIEFKYQPIRDMDVRVERHNYDKVVKNATLINNQKDSVLELQRNGQALKSLINRVGNDSYEVTLRYNIFEPFTLYKLNDYTSDGYKIVKIQLLTRVGSIDVIYKLTKNQSILNPLTAVNRSVSPFTISKRNTLSNFIHNIYVEFGATSRTETVPLSLNGKKALLNALKWNSANDTPMYNAQFKRLGTTTYLNMSVSKFPQGNTLEFNVQFNHPKIAGYQLVGDAIGLKLKPVTYTDAYGQVSEVVISFDTGGVIVPDDHPVGAVSTSNLIDQTTYEIGLNPDEIFGLTEIIHPITDRSNLIIGDYFAENNSLMKELGSAQSTTVKYYDGAVSHSIYDKEAKSGSTGTGSYAIDASYDVLTMSGIPAGSSWVIASSTNDRIYMAYNYDGTDMNIININRLASNPIKETL